MTDPMKSSEPNLTGLLSLEAERFDRLGGSGLEIGQVLDRAGEIRRGRRMRASMLMAACVLAIAVPTVLVATRSSDGHHPVGPAHHAKLDTSPLTIDGLTQGDAPRVAYVQSGSLHQDGVTYTSKGEKYVALAELPHGAMVAVRDDGGNVAAHALDGGTSWPMEGDFAVSTDSNLVAFVEPDGTPVVVSASGTGEKRASYTLPRIPRGSGFDAVALTGTDCKSPSDSVCAVWVNSKGRAPESWVSTPEGATPVQPAPGSPDMAQPSMWVLDDVLDSGARAGMTEATDTGSCSEVESSEGAALWSTCDQRFLSFAQDGSHLLASGAYADGLGDSQMAVLDARTGEVELDLRTVDRAFIHQMVWEDESHVLATVFQAGQWAVLRIGLDGEREYAVEPVPGEDVDSPFVLASR
jgi:hypothetical protein